MTDIFDPSYNKEINIEISDNKVLKGQEVNLTAKDPTMNNLIIGVGWDLNAFDTDTLDLDVSCFLLDKNGKTRTNEDFVFYNNTQAYNDAVVHNGDNRTGAGDGDDESISISLKDIPFDIIKIMFVLSIYKGQEKDQTMASLRNSYIRVVNASNSQELLRYEVNNDVQNSQETGMLVASLNREGPKWHFSAIGTCILGGLDQIATDYDVIIHRG